MAQLATERAMVERAADGILRTHPIETPITRQENGGTDWSNWEAWIRGHLDIERDATTEIMGEVVADLRREIADAVEKRVGPLEGAISVLKGLGPPPGIRFR